MFVQFKNSVNAQGQAVNRIGTTQASVAILEEGYSAGVAGWGWNDTVYGGTALGEPVYFATSGLQTLRVQQREDGVMWDQIVLSSAAWFTSRPGETRMDDSIVPETFGTTDGITASHVYKLAGSYPVVLSVVDSGGLVSAATTTITVTAATAALAAPTVRPGGATALHAASFNGGIVVTPYRREDEARPRLPAVHLWPRPQSTRTGLPAITL